MAFSASLAAGAGLACAGGWALVAASVVAGFVALLFLVGVDWTRVPGPPGAVFACEASALGVPLLIFGLGLSCLLATNAARLALARAIQPEHPEEPEHDRHQDDRQVELS
ncbi:MAG: hypothetical protein JO013_04155 [Alphaproteobacteria bacterium]|nr:hypothetical protein [Alphaproteobacteria bacterium]